jgi:hypothetical protein
VACTAHSTQQKQQQAMGNTGRSQAMAQTLAQADATNAELHTQTSCHIMVTEANSIMVTDRILKQA